MTEVNMYHKIKAVKSNNSIRETAKIIGISTDTVHKYSKISLENIAKILKHKKRRSQFTVALEFTNEKISNHPKIWTSSFLDKQ